MRFFNRVAIDRGFDGMGLGDEAAAITRRGVELARQAAEEAAPDRPVAA